MNNIVTYESFKKKKKLPIFKSRVAQWKRAGPITQRSVDRNYALLKYFKQFKIKFFFFVVYIAMYMNLKSRYTRSKSKKQIIC